MFHASRSVLSLTFVSLGLLSSCASRAIDMADVERRLQSSEGVEGWIHGASPELGLYAFKVQNPKNFFDFAILSLVPTPQVSLAKFQELKRHDRVRIKGSFLENRSAQKHVGVSSLELVSRWTPEFGDPSEYVYQANVPEELLDTGEADFLVHAVAGEGKILVVEYKDVVIPIPLRNPQLASGLYRNDIVRIRYRKKKEPQRPVHLLVRETEENAISVVQSIRLLHQNPASMEGALVLFPKSPEIRRNVFAVLEPLANGGTRQYTLVNFESQEVFDAITKKLEAAWAERPDHVGGRNKLVSKTVRVRAKGVFNVVDANQANVQILLKDADSVEIL